MLDKIKAWDWLYVAVVTGLSVLVVLVVYFGFARVTNSDYSLALAQANTINTKYNNLIDANTAIFETKADSSDKQFSDQKNSLRTAIGEYFAAVPSIEGMKALKNHKVSQAYDALLAKNVKFEGYINQHLTAVQLVHDVAKACDQAKLNQLDVADLVDIVKAYDSAVKDCKAALNKLAESSDGAFADAAAGPLKYLGDTHDLAVKMRDAVRKQQRKGFDKLYDKFTMALDDYGAKTNVTDLLTINASDAPTEELNRLVKLLSQLAK